MDAKQHFGVVQTHQVLQQFGAQIETSSDGLGWSSAFASIQRDQPFDGRFEAVAGAALSLYRREHRLQQHLVILGAESHIRCTMHFAEFRIEDGRSVRGAAEGCWLDPVPVHVENDMIVISQPGGAS